MRWFVRYAHSNCSRPLFSLQRSAHTHRTGCQVFMNDMGIKEYDFMIPAVKRLYLVPDVLIWAYYHSSRGAWVELFGTIYNWPPARWRLRPNLMMVCVSVLPLPLCTQFKSNTYKSSLCCCCNGVQGSTPWADKSTECLVNASRELSN